MAAAVTRRGVTSLLSRTFLSSPSLKAPRFTFAALNRVGLAASTGPTRFKTTSSSGYSPLNDSSPNWSNRPPKDTIMLDGCDYEHWLIVMEFSKDQNMSEEEMVNAYVKTLATVVGR